MTAQMRERILETARFAAALCSWAGEDQAFYDAFWARLLAHPDILKELIYYREKEEFLCRARVAGLSVVDIMVWQIDHFKAQLDQDAELRCNKDRMVLLAFDTMTRMAEDPAPYLARMQGETGTDYPNKY